MIQKISDTFAKLKELEDNEKQKEETFWKNLNELKLPIYLIYEDGKLFKINLIMKFLNNSGKKQIKIFTKRKSR